MQRMAKVQRMQAMQKFPETANDAKIATNGRMQNKQIAKSAKIAETTKRCK